MVQFSDSTRDQEYRAGPSNKSEKNVGTKDKSLKQGLGTRVETQPTIDQTTYVWNF